eukprot:6457178-Amphidinium_carterae.1
MTLSLESKEQSCINVKLIWKEARQSTDFAIQSPLRAKRKERVFLLGAAFVSEVRLAEIARDGAGQEREVVGCCA